MASAKVKTESLDEIEVAAKEMFSAIADAQPDGVRYAVGKLADGVTFVALLEVDEGVENPLPSIPAFVDFQTNLRQWIADDPKAEALTVVGSYRVFNEV